MKLFYKHLFTSIRRRWGQPLILVLTLLLSVLVTAMAFGLSASLKNETALRQSAAYGKADLTVSIGAGSTTRFLLSEDATALLGEECRIAGLYELPLLLGEQTVLGGAADLNAYGAVFPLRFIAYGEITEASLGEVALITHRLAKEQGLSVGDPLSVTVLGRRATYTVAGITDVSFAGSYDVLLDITAVTRAIAAGSPFLSAIGDEFRPAGTLYVDLPEGLAPEEAASRLSASPLFADKSIVTVGSHVATFSAIGTVDRIVTVIILLTAVLGAAVTFCCFSILSSQRSEENAVFMAAGARRLWLDLSQYAEILLYFAVGAPLGLLLARPALSLLVGLAGFVYSPAVLTAGGILSALLIQLGVALLSVTAFLLLRRRRGGGGRHRRLLPLALAAALPLLAVLALCLPPSARFPLGIVSFLFLFLFVFTLTPPLFRTVLRWVTLLLERRGKRRGRPVAPSLYYALKNTEAVALLQNSARLVAVLLSILILTAYLLVSTFGFLGTLRGLFCGEYTVSGGTARCYERIASCESVDRVNRIYLSSVTLGEDRPCHALAVDAPEALAEELNVPLLPRGDEVVISGELSRELSLREGDTVALRVGDRTLTLTVAAIARLGTPMLVFDCAHHGIPYNMLLVAGKEGTSPAVLRQELAAATSAELAGVLPTEELFALRTEMVEIYVAAAVALLMAATVFSVVGLGDNLWESYRSRREEMALYAASGMAARTVRRMKAAEVAVTLLFALLVALLATVIGAALMQFALSVMHDVLLNFLRY